MIPHMLIYGIRKTDEPMFNMNIHPSKLILTFFANISDVEDTFCDICDREKNLWEIDKSTLICSSNANYSGVTVEGSLAKSKNPYDAFCFYMYHAYKRTIYSVLGKRVRIRHPQYLCEGICNLSPERVSDYTCHVKAIVHK